MTPRTRTPSNEVEQAVVDAAARLLEAEGPDALTVRRIATEAGVAPMGVYNHLGGKDGVVDRLFADGFDALAEAFAEIATGDATEDLLEAGRRYRAHALAHPAMYAVMFERAVPGYEPAPEAKEHAARSFEQLVQFVRRAQAAGSIIDEDPVEVAQRVWSLCHGQVSLELRGIGFVGDIDAHHEALLQTMLRGLRPPEE
ncbi:MAG: TetR/AcrR family transcriptional regulator [Microthrixaceae bacterium]